MNIKNLVITFCFCLICLHISAESSVSPDTIHFNLSKDKSQKNLRFSILGGPGYTPDFGFLVGGSALFTFKTHPSDPNLQRSVLPLSFGLTFSKPFGVNVMLKPQMFFKEDKYRLFGTFLYKNTNDNYYGVGYDRNSTIERGENTQYFSSVIQINPVMMFKIKDTHFYAGPTIDFNREKISNPGESVISDPVYIAQGGTNEGLNINSMGAGAIISYDTRDVASNAYYGKYFELKGCYYAKELGSDFSFGTLQFDYRQYLSLPSLGERRVLAWNVISKNAFGDVPFSKYPLIGNPFDLRGYYMGQYRNKSTLVALAEYRHMFNFGNETKAQRFWSRFGFAAWAGAGAMGKNPVNYERILPNFGAGLRVELQPRMNFRLDVGRSPVDKQTLFYFNMTEAF